MEIKVIPVKSTHEGLDKLVEGGKYQGKIGWAGDSVHESVNPRTGVITSQLVAVSALNNEFGTVLKGVNGVRHIVPARPFLRNTIRREAKNWLDAMSAGAELVLNNSQEFTEVLKDVADQAIDAVRDTVRDRVEPPLSPYTVKQRRIKRREKYAAQTPSTDLPLFDTGHMVQTLESEVEPA